jgi:hypothetical protein
MANSRFVTRLYNAGPCYDQGERRNRDLALGRNLLPVRSISPSHIILPLNISAYKYCHKSTVYLIFLSFSPFNFTWAKWSRYTMGQPL